jgi:signal transduction histidine kinase
MKVELRVKKEGPLWVSADQGQLKQVLLNLVNNALESMEGSQGVITLGAWKSKEGLQGRPRPVVILEVTDTGRGIPMEVQKRLFDPFFTTKTEGTGLGLSIAMRIIEKHGGTIRYGTQAGRGTSFQVILPQSTVDEKPA